MKALLFAVLALSFATGPSHGRECDNADALGTSRTIKVRTGETSRIGHGYPALGLAHGEIILTFDDGPKPDTTPAILNILARECIQATFFMIGMRAEAHPELAARVREAGHAIGSHSYTHRELNGLPFEESAQDIQRGYEVVEKAAYGEAADRPRLFRFPGFKSTPDLIALVHAHRGTVVNTNISPADWRGQPARVTFDRLKKLFDRQDRGIVLLHDSQSETVKLLPLLIADMKARGMRIVHLVAE